MTRTAPAVLIAMLLALPARRAHAADACLEGASQLGDRRALAALRTSTEAACPCAGFAGAPGGNRKAYQRCAGDVLNAATAAGELRTECRKAARRVNRGAVCGTPDRVACGRIRPGGRRPIRCAVKPAARCRSGRRFEEHACTAQTHCADVVDWTAGTCRDPRAQGPFVPGVRTITYTKDSVVQPGTPRVLQTVVWYPAAPGSGPIDAGFGAVVDAPVAPGTFPLLMFSHGSCGYPTQSTFLTALVASQGFVVAAPPHPGNTIRDFPGCATALANSFAERPNDVVYVMDQLLAADQDPGSPFFQAVDETRLGMSGHSFGGLTTYLATALDDRFDIAMPLAPAVLARSQLDIPSMTIVGDVDSVVNNTATHAAYERSSPPKRWVDVLSTGHYAFSDGCFPGPDCTAPNLTQAEAHAMVLRYAVPFVALELGGDVGWAPLLDAPAVPGAVLEVSE